MRESANYYVQKETKTSVVLVDIGPWDKHPTITNDAENVVRELVKGKILTPDKRLFYYDSDNNLDEITHENGKFTGFKPVPMK
jgi:hypothetical protein